MRHESCLAAVALQGTPGRDISGVNQLEMFANCSHISGMRWTDDQIAAMKSLGINPAHVPYPDAPVAEYGDPAIDDFAADDLTDTEFALIASALPPEPRQRGAVSNRQVLNALLWVHRTGKRLTQLPACLGTAEAVRKRAERWATAGVWDRLIAGLGEWKASAIRREAIRRIAEGYAQRGSRIRQGRAQTPGTPAFCRRGDPGAGTGKRRE